MANRHLQTCFEKTVASAEKKEFIASLFSDMTLKTVSQIRTRYISKLLKKSQKNMNKKSNINQDLNTDLSSSHNEEDAKKGFRFFIEKMKKDRKEREERIRAREVIEKNRWDLNEQAVEKKKTEEILKAEEEKTRKISEMRSKSYQRKKYAQELFEIGNNEYQKVIQTKPLFQKIEENYLKKVLMPELERHKIELAKKREIFQPIDRSLILEHAKKHDFLMDEHEIQKLGRLQNKSYDPSKLRSKFTLAYLEEQKKIKQQKSKDEIEKRGLVEKKKHYADLVLQMYTPTVDPAKQLEIKLIKKRMEEGFILKKKSIKSTSANDIYSDNEKIKKRKWKENPMIPSPPLKKQGKKIDWLAEQRSLRQQQGSVPKRLYIWDESISQDRIKKQLLDIENEVRKKEQKIQIANQINLSGIKKTEEVGDLLITSIKGKLTILDQNI